MFRHGTYTGHDGHGKEGEGGRPKVDGTVLKVSTPI